MIAIRAATRIRENREPKDDAQDDRDEDDHDKMIGDEMGGIVDLDSEEAQEGRQGPAEDPVEEIDDEKAVF